MKNQLRTNQNKKIAEGKEELASKIQQILDETFDELRLNFIGTHGIIKILGRDKSSLIYGEQLKALLDLGLRLEYIDTNIDNVIQLTLKEERK